MCVCTYMCMHAVHMHVYVEAPITLPLYSMRQEPHWNPEFAYMASLGSQLALGIPLSPLSEAGITGGGCCAHQVFK